MWTGVTAEEASGICLTHERDVDERTGPADRVAADDPRAPLLCEGRQSAGNLEDQTSTSYVDGDREERPPRPRAHRGEIRQVDRERLRIEVLTGP